MKLRRTIDTGGGIRAGGVERATRLLGRARRLPRLAPPGV